MPAARTDCQRAERAVLPRPSEPVTTAGAQASLVVRETACCARRAARFRSVDGAWAPVATQDAAPGQAVEGREFGSSANPAPKSAQRRAEPGEAEPARRASPSRDSGPGRPIRHPHVAVYPGPSPSRPSADQSTAIRARAGGGAWIAFGPFRPRAGGRCPPGPFATDFRYGRPASRFAQRANRGSEAGVLDSWKGLVGGGLPD
jgi:hypothetical protein